MTKWLQLGIKGVTLTRANGDSAEYPSVSPTAEQRAGTPSLMFGVKTGALWTTRWNNCDKAGAEGGGRGTDAPASCYPWHQTHPVLAQGSACDCRCVRGSVSNGQEGRQGLLSHVVSVSGYRDPGTQYKKQLHNRHFPDGRITKYGATSTSAPARKQASYHSFVHICSYSACSLFAPAHSPLFGCSSEHHTQQHSQKETQF